MNVKKFDLTKAYIPRKKVRRAEREYHNPNKRVIGRTAVNLDWKSMSGRIAPPDFTFSVIIPAYNAGKYIVDAMDSVLAQDTDLPLEMIVIDDCSKDDTYEIVEDYARKHPSTAHRCIMLLRNTKNSGVAYSRNQGTAYAGGEYIAFLDADDWWDSSKLRLQYEHLIRCCNEITTAKDRAALVGKKINVRYPVLSCTARQLADDNGTSLNKIIHVPETITYKMLLKTNHIPCSSVLLKTEVAKEFPMRNDEIHEDYLNWLKITKKYGPAVGLDQPLTYSRMTPAGKSRNKFRSAVMQYKCYRHMRVGPIKSVWYMLNYMIEGVNKYM